MRSIPASDFQWRGVLTGLFNLGERSVIASVPISEHPRQREADGSCMGQDNGANRERVCR